MDPLFFSNKPQMQTILSFNEEIAQTNKVITNYIHKQGQNSSIEAIKSTCDKVSYKIKIFMNEFMRKMNSNMLELECRACEIFSFNVFHLHETLKKLDSQSLDLNLDPLKDELEQFLILADECRKIHSDLMAKNIFKLQSPSLQKIETVESSQTGSLTELSDFEQLTLVQSLEIDPELRNLCKGHLQDKQNEKVKLYLENILKIYSEETILDFNDNAGNLVIDFLNKFICSQAETTSSMKLSLAQYHLSCLNIYMHQSRINNLKSAYDELEFILSNNQNNKLSNYIKLKQCELMAIHLQFGFMSRVVGSFYSHYVDKQRRILLSVALDESTDVKLKIKANYMLACSFMKSLAHSKRNGIMAKKSLEYVVAKSDDFSTVKAMSHYYLGFLSLFGCGKNVKIDIKDCIDHFEKATKDDEMLPDNFRAKAAFLSTIIRPFIDCNSVEKVISDSRLISKESFVDSIDYIIGLNLEYLSSPNMEFYYIDFESDCLEEVCYTRITLLLLAINGFKIDMEDKYEGCLYYKLNHFLSTHCSRPVHKKYDIDGLLNSCEKDKFKCYDNLEFRLDDVNRNERIDQEGVCKLTSIFQEKVTSQMREVGFITDFGHEIDRYSGKLFDVNSYQTYEIDGQKYIWKIQRPFINNFNDIILDLILISQNKNELLGEFDHLSTLEELICSLSMLLTNRLLKIASSNMKTRACQENLIHAIHYLKLAIDISKKYSLDSYEMLIGMEGIYDHFIRIVPNKMQKVFLFEFAELLIEKYNMKKSVDSKPVTIDLIKASIFFNQSIEMCDSIEEKIEFAMKMKDLLYVSGEEIGKICNGLPQVMDELINEKIFINLKTNFPAQIAVYVTVRNFIVLLIECLKLEGREGEAYEVFNKAKCLFSIILQYENRLVGILDRELDKCTIKTESSMLTLRLFPQEATGNINVIWEAFPMSPPTLYTDKNIVYKKTAKPGVRHDIPQIQNKDRDITTKKVKQDSLEMIRKQERKRLLKNQKVNSPVQIAASMSPKVKTKSSVTTMPSCIEISSKAMNIFEMLFMRNDGRKLENLTIFDACNFRTDVKIKREEVALLIRELGGDYIPAEGKGSHSKCTIASFDSEDKFTLRGSSTIFANFDMIENSIPVQKSKNTPKSDMVILANHAYLKSYNVRQLCKKLIKLGFTPATVKLRHGA